MAHRGQKRQYGEQLTAAFSAGADAWKNIAETREIFQDMAYKEEAEAYMAEVRKAEEADVAEGERLGKFLAAGKGTPEEMAEARGAVGALGARVNTRLSIGRLHANPYVQDAFKNANENMKTSTTMRTDVINKFAESRKVAAEQEFKDREQTELERATGVREKQVDRQIGQDAQNLDLRRREFKLAQRESDVGFRVLQSDFIKQGRAAGNTPNQISREFELVFDMPLPDPDLWFDSNEERSAVDRERLKTLQTSNDKLDKKRQDGPLSSTEERRYKLNAQTIERIEEDSDKVMEAEAAHRLALAQHGRGWITKANIWLGEQMGSGFLDWSGMPAALDAIPDEQPPPAPQVVPEPAPGPAAQRPGATGTY